MANRRKKAFGGDSSSDSDGSEDELHGYLHKKALKSQKTLQNVGAFNFDNDIDSCAPVKTQPPKQSRFIGNILASKKQRELDRLYSESVRNTFSNGIQEHVKNAGDVYVTGAYQEKKRQIEDAEKIALAEQGREFAETNLNAFRYNARILNDASEKHDQSLSNVGDAAQSTDAVREKEKKLKSYKNDIYISPNISSKPSGQKARKMAKQAAPVEVVQKFLASSVTACELKLLREEYFARVSCSNLSC